MIRIIVLIMFLGSCSNKSTSKGYIMKEDKFWEIVEEFSPNSHTQLGDIRKALNRMPKKELIGFDLRLALLKNQLINRELYAALELVYEGGGDDEYFDFKYFIIYQGKEAFKAAQYNVDDLAKTLKHWRFYVNFIDYTVVTHQVFKERFQEELGDYNLVEHLDDSKGEAINIDNREDLKKRFPELWKIRAQD